MPPRSTAFAVFVLALGVRLAGIGGVLPALHHPDELINERVILRVARDPRASPRFFNYPSLMFYVQAAGIRAYEAVHGDRITASSIQSGGNGRAWDSGHWWAGRAITATFGAFLAPMSSVLARDLGASVAVATVAGLWVALSPLLVADSRFVTTDTQAAFFALATLLATLRLERPGLGRRYLLAGGCVGLAAGTKYNLAVLAVAIVAAHLRRHGLRAGFQKWSLYVAGVASVLAFLVVSPFVGFDWSAFVRDFSYEVRHYNTGHVGAEGDSLGFNVATLWASEGWRLALLALLGLAWARAVQRTSARMAVVAFVAAYVALLSSMEVHFKRNLVPVVAPILVLSAIGLGAATTGAGAGLARVLQLFPSRERRALVVRFGDRWRQYPDVLIRLAGLALCVAPVRTIVEETRQHTQNERLEAEAWIDAHVAAGSRVAVGSYSPWVDPTRFVVRPLDVRRIARRLATRRPPEYDVLVVSERAFGRTTTDAGRGSPEAAAYAAIWRSCPILASFRPRPGREIRVVALTACRPDPMARRDG